MVKTVIKCDRCGLEQEISNNTSRPIGWLITAPEEDLCVDCSNAYEIMIETIKKIREEFFDGSWKKE